MFTSNGNIGKSTYAVKKAVLKAKELGKDNLMIIDPFFYTFIDFYNAAQKEGIKPIFALERTIETLDLIIIMNNQNGYKYLIEKISTECVLSDLNHKDLTIIIKSFNDEEVLEAKLSKINGYIGVYPYKNLEMYGKAARLYQLRGSRPIVPLFIATHENKEDYRNNMILRGIKEEKKFSEVNILEDNFYDRKLENVNEEWISNLEQIKTNCVDDYSFGHPVAPKYKFTKEDSIKNGLSENSTDDELFAFLSRKGLDKRLKIVDSSRYSEYKERLEFEINIINVMGFPGYMLIVEDFVRAAREMSIPVGPGRGSAAGSLVAFSLEITNIDPMNYGLLFERFLNPERVSMPDIDMDFCQARRQEVIRYVEERYGKERVAQIITFGKLVARGTIRDVSRVLGYPLQKTDKLAKIIPDEPGMTLAKAKEMKADELKVELSDIQANKIYSTAEQVEGNIRHTGVHAAGLIISDEPVWKKAPITTVNGATVLQYEGKYTEDVDLIKFDFLGLKTLTVIDNTIKLVKTIYGKVIEIDTIDFSDKKVYELISTGRTAGIFQIESSGMQSLCGEMKPDRFEDLIAILALYRPGPMESGMLEDFVSRKQGLTPVKYFFDDFEEKLKPILEPTYGVIVYQEQVMQIVQEIGGFSLGESDIIRRAMGKKDVNYMNQMKEQFADGAKKQGLNRDHAVKLFDLIIEFAGYGFNKSHSAAYAMVSFQTAYLKTYYPAEFMASLMSLEDDKEKVAFYVSDSRHIGLDVLLPDVNTSTNIFETVDGKTITYSISNLKGVGSGASKIVKERENNGPFTSVQNFKERLPKTNKRIFSALVHSGSFDSISNYRRQLIEEDAEEEYSLSEKLQYEVNVMGEYISDPFAKSKNFTDPYIIPQLTELEDGTNYILIYPQGSVSRVAKKTKKEFVILNVFYNGESKEILAFNDSVSMAKDINMNRPWILKISNTERNGSRTLFLNEVILFSKKNLENYFIKK